MIPPPSYESTVFWRLTGSQHGIFQISWSLIMLTEADGIWGPTSSERHQVLQPWVRLLSNIGRSLYCSDTAIFGFKTLVLESFLHGTIYYCTRPRQLSSASSTVPSLQEGGFSFTGRWAPLHSEMKAKTDAEITFPHSDNTERGKHICFAPSGVT